jgi:TonB family protein
MLELKPLVPESESALLPGPIQRAPHDPGRHDPKQRRLMLVALVMLLVALGFVLYSNRDFWFPDEDEADSDQPAETTVGANTPAQTAPVIAVARASAPVSKSKHSSPSAKTNAPAATSAAPAPVAATTSRTVLPPLEVEVVAGDTHKTVRPGSNSVRVDLQPGSPPRPASDAGTTSEASQSAANVTTNASEHVQMSADTADAVSRSVKPGYPLLARQMKVQGSVILQALIGKDGIIQDLRVLSGPPILASAAQAAVRQWHFKPHYLGNDPVETQAKITVNFTISTN